MKRVLYVLKDLLTLICVFSLDVILQWDSFYQYMFLLTSYCAHVDALLELT